MPCRTSRIFKPKEIKEFFLRIPYEMIRCKLCFCQCDAKIFSSTVRFFSLEVSEHILLLSVREFLNW